MTAETPRRKWRWLRHVAWVLAVKITLIVIGIVVFFGIGAGNPLLRRLAIKRIHSLTGCQTEIRSLSIRWLSLQATINGLVIHGKEPADTEPLFSAEQIEVGLHVDSLWGRKFSFSDLVVHQPHIHLRVEKNGTTNVPASPVVSSTSSKPLRETLLDLRIRHFALSDGWVLYNDVKTPLALEGNALSLSLVAGGDLDHPLYAGTLDWKNLLFTDQRFLPVPLSASTKFTLWRDGLTIEQGQFSAATTRVDLQAEMSNFAAPQVKFRYRAWTNLADFRKIFRAPATPPRGQVDVRGEGTYANGEWKSAGNYSGSDILLTYDVFHQGGLRSTGDYKLNKNGIEISNFAAYALGGSVKGRVTMKLPNYDFRAQTHVDGVRIAQLLPAIEHKGFPIDHLHWDSVLAADTVETWRGAFDHFEISGQTNWVAPDDVAPGHTPVTADWKFDYRQDPEIFTLDSASFETPQSRIQASGTLGHRDSTLDLHIRADELEAFTDLIQSIEAVLPGTPEELAPRVRGAASWDGRLSGPLGSPTFAGHLRGERLAYGKFHADSVEGDLTYSPRELSVARGHMQYGAMHADLEGSLDLDDWSFRPENEWTADVNLEKVPIDSVLALVGEKYPVEGTLTGQFHGRGSREAPAVNGLFDLAEGKVYGLEFNRLRGQINAQPDEVHLSNAELRVFAPGKEAGRGAGIITGNVGYQFSSKNITAELVGAGLPLQNFEKIQSDRLPIFGQLTFHVKASGPVEAPTGDGTVRVVDFRVGQEIIGSFDGDLSSDGKIAKLELHSAMAGGGISGGYSLGLADPYPLSGKVMLQNIELDPFLFTALRMERLSGHGTADGEISMEGNLKQPEGIVMDARFTRLLFNYANVQLENTGPIHFRSSKDEISIEPATFKGTDTNFQIGGNVRFTGRRTVSLNLNGALDLRLLSGFVPDLDARGPAQINAAFEGTLDRPRITGRIHIENAQARAIDFPTGLTAIKGDLVFDASRLYFDNVTAQAGGGMLSASGSVYYADRPIRFDITTHTDGVRIRYPEGMSWQALGNLRLTGTPDGGTLSGRVQIERVNMSGGLEAAGSLFGGSQGGGTASTSPFLRNLQFDVEAVSTPDARMEWPNAELEADASLRVRGTWDHPILLGHIHVLSGDLLFHGSRYRVARGDLNFSNPFQLNPDINVEATTIIQQYEITLNFSGPANKLSLSYRSDPPLPSNDIITLLALGQTSSEAEVRSGGTGANSNSLNSGASALLSEAISSQVGGRLEKLFGITRFRVDPGLTEVATTTGSESNAAARITVEQQIARDLTITYVSNVSSTQQQVIQVEYNINRNVSIVALRDYNGTFGIDVKIKKRFD